MHTMYVCMYVCMYAIFIKFVDYICLCGCYVIQVALWDANTGTRIRKYSDHTAIVNCCSVCPLPSGSTVSADPYLFISGKYLSAVIV
jgi:WD40 repeat protein